MGFWRSKTGALFVVILLMTGLAVGITGVRVHAVTHPARQASADIDFDSILVRVQKVQFPAVDGIELQGWMILGKTNRPPILLCHDAGASMASLVSLAIGLHNRGFSVLLFDFRGHGTSGGRASTLGLHEKRDVLGALDFVSDRLGAASRNVGIYGVGMGAHAAALAAADRPALRVLVLDGLYPDVSYSLVRRVFGGWEPGVRNLAFLPNGVFWLAYRTRIADHRAADALAGLLGRDVLLLAPAGDPELTDEMKRMVGTIPQQPDVDGNLEVLPATQVDGLYGADLARHVSRVTEFFESRLLTTAVGAGAGAGNTALD
jgi:pimeloyl-ACP methyl ester carboxylesterase